MLSSELVNIKNTKLQEFEQYLIIRIKALEAIDKNLYINLQDNTDNVLIRISLAFDVINILPLLIRLQTIINDYKLINTVDIEIIKVLSDYLLSDLYNCSVEPNQLNGIASVNLYNYLSFQKYQTLITFLNCYIKGA